MRSGFIILSLTLACIALNGADGTDLLPIPGQFFEAEGDSMMPYRPEWRVEIVRRHPTGAPKEILFLTPDRSWPMKQLCYNIDGSVACEADLYPYSEQMDGKGSFHGLCKEKMGILSESLFIKKA